MTSNNPNQLYIHNVKRLEALNSYLAHDTTSQQFYDNLTKMLSIICETPISIISFIDDKRQWYKSKIGIAQNEVPINDTICQYTISEDEILEIENTLLDKRTQNNKFVNTENGVRFYAGIPIKDESGYAIGTVCVVNYEPKKLSDKQKEILKLVSNQVMMQLKASKQQYELAEELKNIYQKKIDAANKKNEFSTISYKKLFNAITNAIAVLEIDTEANITFANNLFLNIIEHKSSEIIGQSLLSIIEAEEKIVINEILEKLKKGKSYTGIFKIKLKQEHQIWIQSTFCPLIDSNGNILKITMLSQNISQKIEAQNKLEDLNKQKDIFISNVSHELRTPIHIILGISELLLSRKLDEFESKQVNTIKEAADSLLNLVNSILDISKIESGLFHFINEEFNLFELVENIFKILSIKAEKKNINFHYHIDKKIPEQLIGDKIRLRQILINLLDNAIKFTDKGEVKLRVEIENSTDNKISLVFEVSDTGYGISKEDQKIIFERFTQSSDSKFRYKGGTGLGLNISKQLVEKQNGKISLFSELGKGTKFTFSLTFEIADTSFKKENSNFNYDLKQLKGNILLCEDNDVIQYLVKTQLQGTSLNLFTAFNGIEGIEILKKQKIDIVLMDMQMPELDGLQTTDIIRNQLKLTIPIIGLSANAMHEEKSKCLKSGMSAFISKPFTKEQLLNELVIWLSVKGESYHEKPLLNFTYLNEFTLGNKEAQMDSLQLLYKSLTNSLQLLKSEFYNKNISAIKKEAHKLKSTFGFYQLDTSLLTMIEKEELTWEQLEENINQLEITINKVLNEINLILK